MRDLVVLSLCNGYNGEVDNQYNHIRIRTCVCVYIHSVYESESLFVELSATELYWVER